MASTITTTRTIRITNETADYFKGKPLNKAVESLYELIEAGKLSFDGEKIEIECTHQNQKNDGKTTEGVPQKANNVCTPKSDYELITEMSFLMRVPPDKLLEDIKKLLEEGTLYYSNGKLTNPRYEDFERVCLLKKQDIDKTILNIVRQMGG